VSELEPQCNITHKQVDHQFLLDLICSHKQHFDLSSIYQDRSVLNMTGQMGQLLLGQTG